MVAGTAARYRRNALLGGPVLMLGMALAGVALAQAAGSPAPLRSGLEAVGPEIRAQLRPARQTVLSAGISGELDRLRKRDGDRFKAGEELAGIDCSTQRALLGKAAAELESARRVLSVNERLAKLNATSELEIEVARSQTIKAQADLKVAQATVEKCSIRAPFAGRVAEVFASQHQFVKEGERIIEILDDNDLEVDLIVPSEWLRWLKPGAEFDVDLNETGRQHACEVSAIGAKIDAVSQTIRIVGRLKKGTAGLLPGMSGRAIFPPVR